MKYLRACLAIAGAFSLVSMTEPARAEPPKNIVLVHGAWVDASGWKPVYEILTREGFRVSMVQEPETSFPNDVGLVYVAAHAPDVGENESALGKNTPSVLGKTEGVIKITPDKFTYLDP